MKVLICSDSHGARRSLLRVLEKESPQTLLFLGDGLRDLESLQLLCPTMKIVAVQGNCDMLSPAAQQDLLIELEQVRIYLCHGHRWSVKTGLERLEREGRRLGAQLVLFGHTHRPLLRETDALTLLNPGSIGDGLTVSYAVAEIAGGAFSCTLKCL